MTTANVKIAIQEIAEHSQNWHNGTSTRTRTTKTSDGLAAIQAQLNNLGREIKKGFGSLPSSTEINLRDHVKSILTTIDDNMNLIHRIGLSRYVVSDLQDSMLFFIPHQTTIPFLSHLYHCDKEKGSYGLKDMDAYSIRTTLRNDVLPQKEKDPGSFTLPCYISNIFLKDLANLGASVSVMYFSTYTNLGLGKLAHTKLTIELAKRSVKHPKVVEDMDNYQDDAIGSVIVGKLFCREVSVKTKRFEVMITIFNGIDSVTYQMVRSYPRFKHLTDEQCNKIPPLLKESKHDKMNGISCSYQKLKVFTKGSWTRIYSRRENYGKAHTQAH
uniref:Uncharacterized protein n=1 Tax=Tanacetum cinerariifolium TaxID=118510 RepID=A0A6L2N6S2_TANCI|nr:hypothetical protein [Tanacetum cinerariifolium]